VFDSSTQIPWGMVIKSEESKEPDCVRLVIECRDFRTVVMTFPPLEYKRVKKAFSKLAQVKKETKTFAFSHTLAVAPDKDGWHLFDAVEDFRRQQVDMESVRYSTCSWCARVLLRVIACCSV
jgi:hypothetical protein